MNERKRLFRTCEMNYFLNFYVLNFYVLIDKNEENRKSDRNSRDDD